MNRLELTPADLEQLDQAGISTAEVERQIGLFAQPPDGWRLDRPCTVGDGIVRLERHEIQTLHEHQERAALAGRFAGFVPASGAATRMFRDLLHYRRGPGRDASWSEITEAARAGESRAKALTRLMSEVDRFAFSDSLRDSVRAAGGDLDALVRDRDHVSILDALLGDGGLAYEARPKGLLEFHGYPGGARTALEEHLVEAARYVRGADGRCSLHFTVSAEHRALFEETLERVTARLERATGARFDVEFSIQKPSTDTIAVDSENRPLRRNDGRLLFRPGGHGALIENLGDLKSDLVFVKNIDNVQPDHRRAEVVKWRKTLGGYLVALQAEIHRWLAALRDPGSWSERLEEAAGFAGSRLQVELDGRLDSLPPAGRRALLERLLDRPLRVCGVVPNRGEPGGGPFWVRDRDGVPRLQIVEGAQIDTGDPGQAALLRQSTHFNPVDMVCGLRDPDRRPYELGRFLDPDAVIITEKSHDGRALKALERPGLWNGAMAGWNTVFVEVPLATFAPVKTVFDLLRPEHQPAP